MSFIMRKSVDDVNHQPVLDETTPDDVIEAVHAVMHAYRARQYRLAEGAAGGLTHLEGKVLGFFARHPGATLSELAAHAGRDKGQLARLVGGLKARGLLLATADESDRRAVRLTLSAEAEALHRTLQRRGRQLAAAATAGLGDDERRQLVALLDKLRAQIG